MDADIALFGKVKQGSIASFELIFDKYYQQLCAFSNLYLKDHETAKEVVSDVFSYIWLKREQIDLKANLRSYLFRSVKNLSITRKRGMKVMTQGMDEVSPEAALSYEHADSEILSTEFEKELEGIIEKMPKQRQLIFRMSRLQGLSYNEIAIDLSISPRTVQNHMVEAVKYMSSFRKHLMQLATHLGLLFISYIFV